MNKLATYGKGFTLLELLITIAFIGILMTVAVPSMQSIIISSRLTTQVNDIVGALNIARSEAAKKNKTLTVQKTGGDWSSGWQVFEDTNGNNNYDSGTDKLVRSYAAIKENTVNTSFTTHIAYGPDGATNLAAGNLYLCSPTEVAAFRRITIANSGRIRIETQDTSSESYEDNC